MLLTGFIKGTVAGFVATLPMSITMLIMHALHPEDRQYQLPPEQITEQVTYETKVMEQASREEKLGLTTFFHFGYGAFTGGLYAIFSRFVPLPAPVAGALFGFIIWAGSYLGWVPSVGLHPPATRQRPYRNTLMILSHLVWGATTALLLRRMEN